MSEIPRFLREAKQEMSSGCCEAMIQRKGVWFRCWKAPVEIHHRLPRGRGGSNLDLVGETIHLIALCHAHHMLIEENRATGYSGDLLIDGYAEWDDHLERPVYRGTHPYLSTNYPPEDAL